MHAALHSLSRIFAPFMQNGTVFRSSVTPAEAANAAALVQRWLRDKFAMFLDELLAKLSHTEPGIQVGGVAPGAQCSAHAPGRFLIVRAPRPRARRCDGRPQVPVLHLLMQVVAAESIWLTNKDGQHTVANSLLARILTELLHSRHWNDQLVGAYLDKYANTFDDVRFYAYRNFAYAQALRWTGALGSSRLR